MSESFPLYEEDELRNWLTANGFHCDINPVRSHENDCNWYAYRQSQLEARRCECNNSKPGVQIVIKPSVVQIGEYESRSVEIELRGEVNETWWNLSAYHIKPEDVPEKLSAIEHALVAAWNALRPTP